MKNYKSIISLTLILSILISEILFLNNANAFDIKPVGIFRDGTICLIPASSSGVAQAFSLSSLQSSTESVQTKISSSGSFCPAPALFTGGAILGTTSGKTFQAHPTVQALSRGILISENAGIDGAISSSGDPTGFTSLITRLGGLSRNIFEISLPSACDVVDDDDDAVGASSDLSTLNDFSFITCNSTNGITTICNETNATNALTATNILVPASSSGAAKIRFAISETITAADGNMIDSILIKLDSQDIFCSGSASSPLTATIIAKNFIDTPTITETIGTVDLGIPSKAATLEYTSDIATSLKGEVSTNIVSTTPILVGGSNATANSVVITELDNESIPIGGQSSASLINPSLSSTVEIANVNLWITPCINNYFSTAPAISDITFSDSTLAVSSAPYIVMSNVDDLIAPFGTLVIPIKKGTSGNPTQAKTKITIKNIGLSAATASTTNVTVSLAFFEPLSNAVVNIPAGCSINNSTNLTNPTNFSAYCAGSTRALAQNAVVGGAVNESTGASQITTDNDLLTLTNRNTTLGTPQIANFTSVISMVTPIDITKITTSIDSNSVVSITGAASSSISGAMIKIDLLEKSSTTAFDSVTILSTSDGSFGAKLKSDFSKGDVTLNFKQTVNGTDSTVSSVTVSNSSSSSSSSGSLACDKTVCGCSNTSCTPTINQVLDYIQTNGGLSSVISSGGNIFNEVINSLKKALGLI